MRKVALFGILAGFTGVLGAQEFPRFSFSAGAGFTSPVGRTSANVDTGWNIKGSAGVNFSRFAGVNLEGGYDSMGIGTNVLSNLGYGGGRLSIFSVVVVPIINIMPKGPVDLYITGGGGYYRVNQDFTQPGVAIGTGFDPFFGYYQVPFATDVVVASYSMNKPGVDVGAGIAFGSHWGGKFFAEARYHRIFTGNDRHVDYVPVTFGFRR